MPDKTVAAMVNDQFASLDTPALLQEQVYRQITEKLITGELRPGEPLVIRKLSEAMGTSPMPVRDALQRLAALGVLVGKRTLCVPHLSTRELADIRDIRLTLEGLALVRAVQYADDASIAGLGVHFRKMEKAARQNNLHHFLRANAYFHLHIVHLAASPVLTGIIEPLWLRLGPAIKLTSQELQQLHLTLPVHRKILDALIARDLAAAQQALAEDILDSFGSLVDL
ncbi:GntR family transcriptional regulator [Candidimonas sp. SYP-B2681]|uniref:GntR family transcriptional regulator n=1 Tax=Candidimonas sp. SYP-B2681 TaxID=2497686 RepID=UPI00131572A1|nr:GntR family transcriptional regulator [Candidimonas sp. SYP-B2681]